MLFTKTNKNGYQKEAASACTLIIIFPQLQHSIKIQRFDQTKITEKKLFMG